MPEDFAACPGLRGRVALLAGLAALLLSTGCTSDAEGDTDTDASTGSSTSVAGPDPTSPASTTGSSSETSSSSTTSAESETGAVDTGSSSSGSSTGSAESSSSGSGSETGSTTGGQDSLCPAFADDFEGRLDPVWLSEWPASIEQVGGQTVFTITAQAGDMYPRRLLSWAELAPAEGDTVIVRAQPVAAPTLAGTQINLVVEGPPGQNVTLSLNNPGSLQYRLTSTDGGEPVVWAEQGADFPDGGWLAFAIADDSATAQVLEADGTAVQTFAPVAVPFDLADARVGFAASNWGMLDEDTTLAVEAFELACE